MKKTDATSANAPVRLHTDGSALGNPGPGGWGAIVQLPQKDVELKGGDPHTTNNRMEMKAVIEGLRWIRAHDPEAKAVQLFSDSSLVVNSLNKGWKRKANLDLWAELDQVMEELAVTARWVKGHADDPYNERCDALAVSEAQKESRKREKSIRSDAPNFESGQNSASGKFSCAQCQQVSAGRWGYLPESGMIRVDCAACGQYLKFAPPTPENLKRAKTRILMSKTQQETFQSKMAEEGHPLAERDLKILKGLTPQEAEARFRSQSSLF